MLIRAKTRSMILGPWSKVLGIRFSTIGDFETKVFERNYVIAIICFFDTCNQKTILQLRDGKFFAKTQYVQVFCVF